MNIMIGKRVKRLAGEITLPGDKSISHRAVMFGALAKGTTRVTNFLQGADCLSTIGCFRSLGISIENTPSEILVHGKGLSGFTSAASTLYVGNSGTTLRLITGILSAQPFETSITGDESIQRRPMKRIIDPLSAMGADIISLSGNHCAPLRICGKPLQGIHYESPVSSAQVKSAILLAGLYAASETTVTEPALSRNHTEIMLRSFGAKLTASGRTMTITPQPDLRAQDIHVPGDISSAAYFIAAALIVPGSDVLIKNVGINPTRDGILTVARAMGGKIELLNRNDEGEPTADIHVTYSELKGTIIKGDLIPTLIDELPVIAVMAAAASGTTIIRDAAELRVKESDRIQIMVENLTAMGATIEGRDDGMIIEGKAPLHGADIATKKDHRIAMSFAVAALIADGDTRILDSDCTDISYPGFYEDLAGLSS